MIHDCMLSGNVITWKLYLKQLTGSPTHVSLSPFYVSEQSQFNLYD